MQRTKRIPRIGTAPKLIAVAAVAMIAASACAPLQLGAAATYDTGQRITQSQLAAEVSHLNAGYQADKSKLSFKYTPADMPRQVLSWMLRFAAMDKLAASQSPPITVTNAEIQATDQSLSSQVRQNGLTLDEAAVGVGLPPNMLPAYERFAVIQGKLAKQFGNPTTSAEQAAAQAKFARMVCTSAKSLNISVNPQYGAFDYRQFLVVATANPLAAPQSGSKLPSLTDPSLSNC